MLPSVEEGSNPSSDVTFKSGFAGVNNKPSNNLLPIVPVKVKLRNKEKYVTTQVPLDSGITNSFITHNLIRQLEINETSIVDVITHTIQSAPEKRKAQLVVNIEICDLYESGCLILHPLLSLPSIPTSPNQWWILGEANEAVASGPPFFWGPPLENNLYSFGFAQWTIRSEDLFFFFFLEDILILEEKEGNQR